MLLSRSEWSRDYDKMTLYTLLLSHPQGEFDLQRGEICEIDNRERPTWNRASFCPKIKCKKYLAKGLIRVQNFARAVKQTRLTDQKSCHGAGRLPLIDEQ